MTEAALLRIFVGEDDRRQGAPLYGAIVHALYDAGISGATVLKGIEGFGARHNVHTARALEYSDNLPVVVEVLEEEAAILRIIPLLREMIDTGLITVERASVLRVVTE